MKSVSLRKLTLFVGVLLLIVVRTSYTSSVYIRSNYGQLVTSSTLEWASAQNGSRPADSVAGGVVDDETTFVCRALHRGLWLSGDFRLGRCVVGLYNKLRRYDKYEILVNIDKSARLQWVFWNKFEPPPSGAVSSGEMFVARRKVDGDVFVGLLNAAINTGQIHAMTTKGIKTYTDGDVLVEIEPLEYEVKNLRPEYRRTRLTAEELLLNSTVLVNKFSRDPVTVAKILTYESTDSLYFSATTGVQTGLPATVYFDGHETHLTWGIPVIQRRIQSLDVSHWVPPLSSINVTVTAVKSTSKIPYTGSLVAIYGDGSTLSRIISSNFIEVQLVNVTVDYTQPYYITNNTQVPSHLYTIPPTTTSTTTTKKQTTTTTDTTSTRRPTTITGNYLQYEPEGRSNLEEHITRAQFSRERPYIDQQVTGSGVASLEPWFNLLTTILTLALAHSGGVAG